MGGRHSAHEEEYAGIHDVGATIRLSMCITLLLVAAEHRAECLTRAARVAHGQVTCFLCPMLTYELDLLQHELRSSVYLKTSKCIGV